MPDEKEPKLDAADEAGVEMRKVDAEIVAEPALEESEREEAVHAEVEEAVERENSKPGKHKKSRKVQRFNPRETKREEQLAGLPLATFKQRLIAFAIDFLIVCIIGSVVASFVPFLVVNIFHVQPAPVETTNGATRVHVGSTSFDVKLPGDPATEKLVEIVQIITILFYFGPTVWLTNGLTLGKRIMKIRVVSLTHERITLWQSCERALGYGASGLEAGFGFFQFFIYKNRTCVHDRIAETIVVMDARIKKQETRK